MERLEYRSGNEYSPSDPFGRVDLDVTGDGAVRLTHVTRMGTTSWTARVDSSYVDRVLAALTDAGFPAAPSSLPLPGERMRELRLVDEATTSVLLAWYAAKDLPGYGEAFALLDTLVTAIGGPDVGATALIPAPTDVTVVDPA